MATFVIRCNDQEVPVNAKLVTTHWVALLIAGCSSGGSTGDHPGQGGTHSTGGAGVGATAGDVGAGGAGGVAGSGGAATGGAGSPTGGAASVVLPAANAGFDYQIGGAYPPPAGVTVVSRDRADPPAPGLYNICYVNGFQTQPQEESFWLGQHPDLVLRDGNGDPVVDPDWGEDLLDTSTDVKRTALAAIVGGWISQCAADGFNAVEIDNLDSYSRSGGLLTQANNVAFMALLSATAHSNGLAVGQKNSVELLGSSSEMGTDFAVAEECNRYDECDAYRAVYGDLVFAIEYRLQDFQAGCANHPELSIVLRDLDVSTPSSSTYVYDGC
jgi:hypothetical protein